jgi:mxaJ protein
MYSASHSLKRAIFVTITVALAIVGATKLPQTFLANLAAEPYRLPREKILRIAADPNNLPFTNAKLEGFENRIAELIASELGLSIEYEWSWQRRGFFRRSFKEGDCDIVLGVPRGFDMVLCTDSYYRSSYAFVYRKDRNLRITSYDDAALRDFTVGVQLIGDDGVNTPPAHALARRGLVNHLVGYTVYGDYSCPNPPARIIEAVARREVDVAIVWGPLAGFFARESAVPLVVVPVEACKEDSACVFDIAIGLSRKNKELRSRINEILKNKRSEIQRILDEYSIPRVESPRIAAREVSP